jgi:hypothetical protein
VSAAIKAMTGLDVAPDVVAMSMIGALRDACVSRRPMNRLALVVTPETAYLAQRIELVDQFHSMAMRKLASRIARHAVRRDELLLVIVGDDAPVLRSLPLAPVRYALNSNATAESKGRVR